MENAYSLILSSDLLPIINQKAFGNRDPSNSAQDYPRIGNIALNVLRKRQTTCHCILQNFPSFPSNLNTQQLERDSQKASHQKSCNTCNIIVS